MKTPINIRSAIMPQDEAEALMDEYVSRILKAIDVGWRHRLNVQSASPQEYSILTDRSDSSNVYDWISAAIQHEFKDDAPDVRVSKWYKSVRINFKDRLISKLNKANSFGRISRN